MIFFNQLVSLVQILDFISLSGTRLIFFKLGFIFLFLLFFILLIYYIHAENAHILRANIIQCIFSKWTLSRYNQHSWYFGFCSFCVFFMGGGKLAI